ncbi:hypothetical protein ACLOJK_019053 [Asimina triloba]
MGGGGSSVVGSAAVDRWTTARFRCMLICGCRAVKKLSWMGFRCRIYLEEGTTPVDALFAFCSLLPLSPLAGWVIVAEEDAPVAVVAVHGDGFRFPDLDWGVAVGDLPWRSGAGF